PVVQILRCRVDRDRPPDMHEARQRATHRPRVVGLNAEATIHRAPARHPPGRQGAARRGEDPPAGRVALHKACQARDDKTRAQRDGRQPLHLPDLLSALVSALTLSLARIDLVMFNALDHAPSVLILQRCWYGNPAPDICPAAWRPLHASPVTPGWQTCAQFEHRFTLLSPAA